MWFQDCDHRLNFLKQKNFKKAWPTELNAAFCRNDSFTNFLSSLCPN